MPNMTREHAVVADQVAVLDSVFMFRMSNHHPILYFQRGEVEASIEKYTQAFELSPEDHIITR